MTTGQSFRSLCHFITERHTTLLRYFSHVHRPHKGLRLKKHAGQHLLVSESVLKGIVKAADYTKLVKGTQQEQRPLRLLEIGPGTGNLTSALLKLSPSVQVHGVEYDLDMIETLRKRFPSEIASQQLILKHMRFENIRFNEEYGSLQTFLDAVVANIPYQLSSLIIARLALYMHTYPTAIQCIVLLVQDEFAQRMLAKPGNQKYGRLSVNCYLAGEIQSIAHVHRSSFFPVPKVDSHVIKIIRRPESNVDAFDLDFLKRFDTLLRVCFLRKNKTLRSLFTSQWLRQHLDDKSDVLDWKERTEQSLVQCDISSKRAVQISPLQYIQLFHALENNGVKLRPTNSKHFES